MECGDLSVSSGLLSGESASKNDQTCIGNRFYPLGSCMVDSPSLGSDLPDILYKLNPPSLPSQWSALRNAWTNPLSPIAPIAAARTARAAMHAAPARQTRDGRRQSMHPPPSGRRWGQNPRSESVAGEWCALSSGPKGMQIQQIQKSKNRTP